jgi:predicted RNase H-like HicB family nuclease
MSTWSGDYILVIEKSETGYGVYAPDLPGCIATGKTRAQALQRMREAVTAHIAGLREDGLPIPAPTTEVDYISV